MPIDIAGTCVLFKAVFLTLFHPIARETVPDPHAKDGALQRRLWKMTEDFIAAH